MEKVTGNIVDVFAREIYPGEVFFQDGRIVDVVRNSEKYEQYICPGFIDAHVHVESSMLTPFEFSRLVISKGTVAVVCDPHEIANVMGVSGVEFMQNDAEDALVKMFFGIPSCVPATPFDSAGSEILSEDVCRLAASGRFVALSEMMNVPGVLNGDPEVVAKLKVAQKFGLRIDGHAPGLSGDDLKKYVAAGIETDHESSSLSEALEKISQGMKIIIREGSAARNYEALKMLLASHPGDVMFCTDDAHPDDLIENGHIDKLVRKAVKDGYELFDVLRAASLNPVKHYRLDVGLLQKGDFADFIILENLETFEILSVYIQGVEKYKKGRKQPFSLREKSPHEFVNRFYHDEIRPEEIQKSISDKITCIKVYDGELVTGRLEFPAENPLLNFQSDPERDILKIVYINRYKNLPPQVAFIHGFGLKSGAFATSVAHDSHNILAVGCNDCDLVAAVNSVIRNKGGLAIADADFVADLPLPIGGIMSDKSGVEVASVYKSMNEQLKNRGCILKAPFMTLAFMSLIVIPDLKIGEKGLFGFKEFCFIS